MQTLEDLRLHVLGLVQSGDIPEMPSFLKEPILRTGRNLRIKKLVERIDLIRGYQWHRRTIQRNGQNLPVTKQAWQTKQKHLLGKTFETLVNVLFENALFFTVGKNARSGTNEIDLYITLHQPAREYVSHFNNHNSMVSEVKCHKKAPKSELVNETAGVCNIHHSTFGLIFCFSAPGKLHHEAKNAIRNHRHDSIAKFTIVPIGRTQIEEAIKGKHILQIIEHQLNIIDSNLAINL